MLHACGNRHRHPLGLLATVRGEGAGEEEAVVTAHLTSEEAAAAGGAIRGKRGGILCLLAGNEGGGDFSSSVALDLLSLQRGHHLSLLVAVVATGVYMRGRGLP